MTQKKVQVRPPRHGETAAHYLVAGVPRARPEQTAGEVLAALLGRHYDCVDCLCLIDDEDRLVGMVPLAQLLAMPRERRLHDEIRPHVPHVLPDVDQERVASVALHHGLSAVPVVDRSARLLGVVPSGALMHILRREHVEDIHRLSGVGRETHRAREAIESPPLRRARHRLPWLLVGLVGSMLATLVVAGFEDALAANVAVAFFIPGLVYLADAIGTQSEAVAVRGLSLSHAGLGQLIGGEMRTGLLMGATLAAVALPLAWLAFGNWQLAAAVALALVCAGAVATSIGLLLPWLLSQLGTDPAYGSGPLATIVQDLLTLLIYFGTVHAIVV
jgi:magnesium transporter